ncbi:MAG: hypothetical protein EBU46_00290 [Nitrosomonadaceae bacterium]|nr:hypothetical protein [Nitrosomonadaceae bacterium]
MTIEHIGMMLDELESAVTSTREALLQFEHSVEEEAPTARQLEFRESLVRCLEELAAIKRSKTAPTVCETRRDEEGFAED